MPAATVADVERAKAEGKLAVAFDLEGGIPLQGRPEMVQLFHELGVRQIHLAYNRNNEIGGGCYDEDLPLSPLGRRIVRAASRGARGWSGLLAALDFELEVDRDDDLRTLNITKMRDASDAQAGFCYVLRPMHLGENPYGEPITAVYVEHRADSGQGKSKGKRISPKARAAYEKLWAMIKDHSQSFKLDGGPLRCVLMRKWCEACCQPGVLGQIKDASNRRKKFYTAREELLEKGKIVIDSKSGDGDDYDARVYPSPDSE